MMLALVAPYKQDYERHIFECPKCEYVEHHVIGYR